jgi:protein-tyrosine phosphatase
MKILLVCLGNICRSPTAEAAVREALADAGLDDRVEVDSAGTGSWHLGDPPDPRMRAAAAAEGLELDGSARRVRPDDFERYDLLLAMDRSNAHELVALAPDGAARAKVRLFREFDPEPYGDEVPDPYFGGEAGFTRVVALCRRTAEGLVQHLEAELRR